MSEKIKGFTVTLDQSVSEEYADRLKEAIEMMAHVISVTPSKDNIDDQINRDRLKHEFTMKLLSFAKEI
jgi:hypothetical protein